MKKSERNTGKQALYTAEEMEAVTTNKQGSLQINAPEVLHEVPELVHPPRQGHDNVDKRVGHVEFFLFHFHDGAKGSK